MNSIMCLNWIKKYGHKDHDKTTTEYVLSFVVDIALENCINDDEIRMCESARSKAASRLKDI